MMNFIWAGMILFSVITAFFNGSIGDLTNAVMSEASGSVQLILSLTGALCFWSGISEIAEHSGFASSVKKLLSPILHLIFPDLDKSSPVFNAISMNIAANLLGLGNAATPLGLQAMKELQKLNTEKNTASVEMMKFVVMNTASMQLIPTTAAMLRAEAGSNSPFDILVPVWISSFCSLTAALITVGLFTREKRTHKTKKIRLQLIVPPLFILPFLSGSSKFFELIGNAALPVCLFVILSFAVIKGEKVFDRFIEGSKKGLTTAVNLLPSLCGLVTAVGMLRASKAMDLLVKILSPVGKITGIPDALLPMCLLRPLSGSGGLSVYKNILSVYGADSVLGRTAAVLSGASETTFYALTVYFGSVNIKNTGCTLPCALLADLVCYITACRLVH